MAPKIESSASASAPETTSYDAPLLSNPAIVPAGLNIIMILRALLAGRHDVSLIVHENTALKMKDYRKTYGYLLPAVVVETLWNILLVVHSVVALLWITREESNVMLRVWICGYSVHCVVNVVLLVMEYVKRNDMSVRRVPSDPNASVPGMSSGYSTNSDGGDQPAVPPTRLT
ncbi:E3 ubiquitin protein ligase RIE1-like [Bidens hawaiensis]|uniref:E3 ubiquitin protein ligase RIE1-like n=1 Tax=Bidens hawaiensis TaxID=980011 RepID=UPI00404B64AD